VVMKSSVFWDIVPCSPLKVNRRLGGTCRLHLQGRRINQPRTSVKEGGKQSLNFSGLHGVISQKTEQFAIFLGCEKSSDKTWPAGLVCKLLNLHFPGYVVRLIHSYL
jgi:hypothetical protein